MPLASAGIFLHPIFNWEFPTAVRTGLKNEDFICCLEVIQTMTH